MLGDKTVRLLRDLLYFAVDVTVLSSDFVVYSGSGARLARGVSLLMMRSLGAKVDHVDVKTVRRSRYCREKQLVSSRFCLSAQRSVGTLFLLPSVRAVPGGSGAPSFNGMPPWTPS